MSGYWLGVILTLLQSGNWMTRFDEFMFRTALFFIVFSFINIIINLYIHSSITFLFGIEDIDKN